MHVLAVAGGYPLWVSLLGTLGAGLLAAAAGAFPWWKEHRDRARSAVDRDRRIEETCDAVLGRPADPRVGRYERTAGLIEIVPNIQATIGQANGKSIMEHIGAIETHLGMEEKK